MDLSIGAQINLELDGIYIYGDYALGTIWGLRYEDSKVIENKIIAESPMAISSFGEDEAGEVYVVGYSGSIYRFIEKEGTPPTSTVPQTIAESGLFKNIETLTLADGLIPYTVNAQLWSDNALKTRILALPDTTKVEFSQEGNWKFPPNAVVVKNFFLETERGNPESTTIIETRFLVRHANKEQWDGFSYLWNDNKQTPRYLRVVTSGNLLLKKETAPIHKITIIQVAQIVKPVTQPPRDLFWVLGRHN